MIKMAIHAPVSKGFEGGMNADSDLTENQLNVQTVPGYNQHPPSLRDLRPHTTTKKRNEIIKMARMHGVVL